MTAENSNEIARKSKQIYKDSLSESLEASNFGEYVAIEPESGDYFVAVTFVEAALAAKSAHPERKSFVLRIGHGAAFHLGACSK